MSRPRTGRSDRFAAARTVADAVLYEGAVLYPYRASAQKNHMRWQFGVLVPPACHRADPSERTSVRTECLVELRQTARLVVRVRCLHLQKRSIESVQGVATAVEPSSPWDETVEQAVELTLPALLPPDTASRVEQFQFPSADETQVVRSLTGEPAAWIVRRRELIEGRMTVGVEPVEDHEDLAKVSVTVTNVTLASPETSAREDMLRLSLVSTHTMLAVDGGRFLSAIDPPEERRDAAVRCISEGTYPVLVGPDDNVVLSSPIVLYDHPQVAPASPGDLYDATEIDEILALRVLALTDAEKAEARATDPKAAAVVDRVEQMTPEDWVGLHGVVRTVRAAVPEVPAAPEAFGEETGVPWWDPDVEAAVDPATDTVRIGGVEIGRGARVVLRPARGGDAQDIFLAGQPATVAAVYRDVDGGEHLAVTLDADPGAELYRWQGRYLYFRPDEIEISPPEDTT